MSGALSLAVSVVVSIPLACFATRRLIVAVAAVLSPRPLPAAGSTPSLAILVAARNEAATVGATLEALGAIDYPPERLRIVLVDDASSDGTGELLKTWAAERAAAQVIGLPEPLGKAQALNRAIAAVPQAELLGISDADQRPRPDCFRRIADVFADPDVGAVAGYLVPANAGVTPIAHYAGVEAWVHQLVTSAGKDRLDLNPPMLGGACAYRRSALAQVGGFRPGAHGEDVESTVALTRAGWRTRFVPDAVADNIVVHTWRDYWRQHIRWARSLFDAGRQQTGRVPGPNLAPLARRIELWVLSAGYADRVALVAAAILAGVGIISVWIPVAYLVTILPGLLIGLVKARTGLRAPAYLAWTIAFFALDIGASLTAVLAHLRRAPRVWLRPERPSPASESATAVADTAPSAGDRRP
jgi:cellulose synthase/poly-beta-1,6-N-acetylglucosamine synthase-like glycosyltransferase